jgi:5-methylcytosine-specific restriction enzyme A
MLSDLMLTMEYFLSPVYDALFDRHLVSFENNGKIILNSKIELNAFEKIGVTGKERISNFSGNNLQYLQRHREEFSARF